MDREHSLVKGAGLILLSELFMVLSGLIIRQVATDLPVEVIVFFRNLLGLMLLLPWLIRKGRRAIRTQVLRFHFMRAAVGVTAMSCLFYAWANLPLAQAALLKQTAPFFVPLIGFFWLRERISLWAKLALPLGFLGVITLLDPREGVLNLAVIVAVAGAALGALAKVTVRRMAVTEGAQRIVFYFAFFSTFIALVPALLVWQLPDVQQLLWLGALAGTATMAQLLLSKGYSYAPAGQLAPYTYGSVVFAALLGWWVWGEALGINSFAGIVLIFLAGLLAMRRSASL